MSREVRLGEELHGGDAAVSGEGVDAQRPTGCRPSSSIARKKYAQLLRAPERGGVAAEGVDHPLEAVAQYERLTHRAPL